MINLQIYSNILKNLLKRELDYVSISPNHALLFMTYRCTSRCEMCTIWKRGKEVDADKELSLEDWKNCVDKIGLENLEVVELFGGDSLLRKDVTIPLIEYIMKKNKNIIVDLPINSILLDKKTAIDLVKAGVGRLYVSLDGPDKIHDEIRGSQGTFKRVENGLKYLIEAKKELGGKTPEILINCTISSSNVDNFEQIIPFAEKLGVDTLEFEYVGEFKEENIKNTNVAGLNPTPFYITLGDSNLLNREQALLLKKKINDIRKSTKNLKMKIITRPIDALTIDNLTNGTVPNKKCYVSRYTVSIDPYGNLMGCFHFNNYLLGNIKSESFSSIWNNNRHRNFFKSQKKGEIKICKNCISGIHRNPTFFQSLYRSVYFSLKGKGFDE